MGITFGDYLIDSGYYDPPEEDQMPGDISRSYKGPKDGRLPTWLGECLICWKGQPDTGWYRVDPGDEGEEFFCSEQCYRETQPAE